MIYTDDRVADRIGRILADSMWHVDDHDPSRPGVAFVAAPKERAAAKESADEAVEQPAALSPSLNAIRRYPAVIAI